MRVTIAFDPGFGETGDIPQGEAFWLVASPANHALADRLRTDGGRDPNSAVFAKGAREPTDLAIQIWFEVRDHHPSMTEAVLVGYAPTPDFLGAVQPWSASLTDGVAILRES